MGKKNKDGQQIFTGIIRIKLQTIQLFRLEKFFVSCWWNFCFLLVELLFSAGGTSVFCWWNFYFHLVELLFSLGETPVSAA